MADRINFKLQVEWRSPDSIKPYHRNNKKHTDSTVEKLAAHIKAHGWDVPIVVDEHGVIIKGHRRHRAAKLLELKSVPVIVRTDLPPEEVRAARLADNRLDDDSPDDLGAIATELEEMAHLDVDLSFTGFDVAEIDRFLSERLTESEPGERGPGSGDYAEEFEEDGDEGNSVGRSPAEKFALAIVLTAMQKQQWEGVKEVLGVKGDTPAFLKVLEQGINLR